MKRREFLHKITTIGVGIGAFSGFSAVCCDQPSPLSEEPCSPFVLLQSDGANTGTVLVIRKYDGSFAFADKKNPNGGVVELADNEGKKFKLKPYVDFKFPENKVMSSSQIILGEDGELYGIMEKPRDEVDDGERRRIGVNYFRDIWFAKTRGGLSNWEEPKIVWRGYIGAIMEYEQLDDGRLYVPFGAWMSGVACAPPVGCNQVTAIYSDDKGKIWQEIEDKLQAPCYDGYNGNNYGACEPAIEEFDDRRIWMLMRSQTGFLYESVSDDKGMTWANGRASRFNSSSSPPGLFRDKNGRLVLCWNNCEVPPRINGAGVYGGRDAIHIAISEDEGKTWIGFREIYRDPFRNETPPKSGDRGTAYPLGAYDAQGRFVIISGQGSGRRNVLIVNPKWIKSRKASTDFCDGVEDWHVYKQFGPAKNWWRDRTMGCEILQNPTNPEEKCLHVRKPDDKDADGATWNLPNGWEGSVLIEFMVREGCQGGFICLNDRMFDPIDDNGERFSLFRVGFSDDYKLGKTPIKPDRWYEIELSWNLSERYCILKIDGEKKELLRLRNYTINGINYIRFRSAAKEIDKAGFLINRVEADIENNHAPECSLHQQKLMEKIYKEEFMPFWNKTSDMEIPDPNEIRRNKDKTSPV